MENLAETSTLRKIDLNKFLFELNDSCLDTRSKPWTDCFSAIPQDPYIKEGYRFKQIAWFRVKHRDAAAVNGIDAHLQMINEDSGMDPATSARLLSTGIPAWEKKDYQVWELPQYAMQQSSKYNPVHGDIPRQYESIPSGLKSSEDIQSLLIGYAEKFALTDAIILMQFQRVLCSADQEGHPAVEGFHQDGNLHVAMLIANRINIKSSTGVSQYTRDENGKCGKELVFNSALQPGELVYWNDKKLWHFGTPIEIADPAANGGLGYRDIVLMSAKTPPQHLPLGPVPERLRNW